MTLKYRTDPLTNDEDEMLNNIIAFNMATQRMPRSLTFVFLLDRADKDAFDPSDMVALLRMSEIDYAKELCVALSAAPCFCSDPDCARRRVNPNAPSDMNPLDRPANPGESEYSAKLSKLAW